MALDLARSLEPAILLLAEQHMALMANNHKVRFAVSYRELGGARPKHLVQSGWNRLATDWMRLQRPGFVRLCILGESITQGIAV